MSQETARKVLEIEAEAIRELIPRLDDRFEEALDILFSCQGRVIATGMGKSGFIAQKLSATLSSTGTPSLFLHPAEAIHGDLGRIVKGDAVIAISHSGDTPEIVALIPTLKRLGAPIIALTGGADSALASAADVHIDVAIREEACPLGLAPTASTTAALAMGDALAMALLERRGFTVDDFADLHPGGKLGRALLRVEDAMHTGEAVPRVGPKTPLKDVLFEMTQKRLGMTTVVDEANTLLGVISDGDLRRLMEKYGAGVLGVPADQGMTRTPRTIYRREVATRALDVMETNRITSLVVIDASRRVEGVLHLHDLWKTEMV
jgi:arabinose-5-phosphate isomerase